MEPWWWGWTLLLTHFLFLPVQLVGCVPPHQGLWGLWNNHFTVVCVTALQPGCTDPAESLRRVPVACDTHSGPEGVLLSRKYHCTVDLWSVQAWKVHPTAFLCLGVSQVSVHIFTSWCVGFSSSRFFFFFFLHLFECANGKLNGWGSLLSFSFTTLFQFSLCPSLSSTARSSALLGMAWHHFVYSSLLLWFLKNSFFDLFIFLFRVLFSLLFLSGMSERILVWHYCTIADIFLLAVGFFFFFFFIELQPSTATSNSDTAGTALHADNIDIHFLTEQTRGRINLFDC